LPTERSYLLPPLRPSGAFAVAGEIGLAAELLRHPLGLERLLEPEGHVVPAVAPDMHVADGGVHLLCPAVRRVVVAPAAILPWDDGVVRPIMVEIGIG
jgi:hypothetical protein